MDRMVHIFLEESPHMDRTGHICLVETPYMDRTVHIFLVESPYMTVRFIFKSSLLSRTFRVGGNPFREHVPGKMNMVTLEIM